MKVRFYIKLANIAWFANPAISFPFTFLTPRSTTYSFLADSRPQNSFYLNNLPLLHQPKILLYKSHNHLYLYWGPFPLHKTHKIQRLLRLKKNLLDKSRILYRENLKKCQQDKEDKIENFSVHIHLVNTYRNQLHLHLGWSLHDKKNKKLRQHMSIFQEDNTCKIQIQSFLHRILPRKPCRQGRRYSNNGPKDKGHISLPLGSK